jgi:hypothetical protein
MILLEAVDRILEDRKHEAPFSLARPLPAQCAEELRRQNHFGTHQSTPLIITFGCCMINRFRHRHGHSLSLSLLSQLSPQCGYAQNGDFPLSLSCRISFIWLSLQIDSPMGTEQTTPTVFVLDDEPAIQEFVKCLSDSVGLHVETFPGRPQACRAH